MKIRFEEFRFTPSPFAATSRRRLKIMIDRIARMYQGAAGKNIGLENTNVLLVYIDNCDWEQMKNKELSYSLGKTNEYIGWF